MDKWVCACSLRGDYLVVMSMGLCAFMALTKTKKDETNNVMYGHLD